MKHLFKVLDVLTMAHNDHRIILDSDHVRAELTVKRTTGDDLECQELLDIKKFQEEEVDLFNEEKIESLELTIDDLNKEITSLKDDHAAQIKELQAEIEDATTTNKQLRSANSGSAQMETIVSEKKNLQNELQTSLTNVEQLNKEKTELQNQVAALEEEVAKLKKKK